jgi:hypothetical protein
MARSNKNKLCVAKTVNSHQTTNLLKVDEECMGVDMSESCSHQPLAFSFD